MITKALAMLTFLFISTITHASPASEIDKAWVSGQPWPQTWGLLSDPQEFEWNRVIIAFVNEVFDKDEVRSTAFKDIPYALEKDSTVEICMAKKGVFNWATLCRPAIVDPDIRGSIVNGDVVAVLHAFGGTSKWFNDGPGTDQRKALRIAQRLAPKEDASCWEGVIVKRPIAQVCLDRFDGAKIEQMLTRDFGPRAGSSTLEKTQ